MSAPGAEAVSVLTTLASAGVRLAPDGTSLRSWSPVSLTPEQRELIRKHKPALLAYLTIWNLKRAIALGDAADELVASLDVSGQDPVIQTTVNRYSATFNAHDMAGVRLAALDLEERARALAAASLGAPKTRTTPLYDPALAAGGIISPESRTQEE